MGKEIEHLEEKINELEDILYSLQISLLESSRTIVDLNKRLTTIEEKCNLKKNINPYGYSFID